jgi:hypothetical protein
LFASQCGKGEPNPPQVRLIFLFLKISPSKIASELVIVSEFAFFALQQ